MNQQIWTRNPVVSGRFYPDDAEGLTQVVDNFLRVESSVKCPETPSLLIMLPHAGYMFSGAVAGATLRSAFPHEHCILLGPNHTGKGRPLSVWAEGEWLTPLGGVPVDSELAAAMIGLNVGFEADVDAHLQEHSLEVLLPFFQRKFARPGQENPVSSTKPGPEPGQDHSQAPVIVPVCVGSSDLDMLRRSGQALGRLLLKRQEQGKPPVTLVVSSDMSHYVSHSEAGRLDSMALEKISDLDPEGLLAVVRENKISMCGAAPATLALFACLELGVSKAYRVAYANSGQTGRALGASLESVVGYAGVIAV